jgi:hypothetical protein
LPLDHGSRAQDARLVSGIAKPWYSTTVDRFARPYKLTVARMAAVRIGQT